jgi:hypothetical protein
MLQPTSLPLRRPYVGRGVSARCLLLLSQLQAMCSPLSVEDGADGAGGQEDYLFLDWLEGVICSAADELASHAGMHSVTSLWGTLAPQQGSNGGQQQQQQQPADDQQGSRVAHLALHCVAGSLRLLLSSRQRRAASATANVARARLAACCLDAVCGFAAAREVGQAQQQAAPASAKEWERVAAQLVPLPACCHALAAALQAGLQLGQVLPPPQLARASQASAAALDAVLSLQAAAAAASAAGDGCEGGRAAAAWCHRLSWKAADGLLMLRLQLEQLNWKAEQQQAQGWEQQQGRVLAAALLSLEAEGSATGPAADPRRLLLQLRCCRLLLPRALQQPTVRQQALALRPAAALTAAAGSSDGDEGTTSEAELAGWLCHAAWRAYSGGAAGSRRRRAGLTAALASTCLHPALFCTGPALDSIHAPGGALSLLLERLLAAGSKSWRVQGIVALQASHLRCSPGLCASLYS